MAQHRVQRRSIVLIVLATLIPLAVVSGLVMALSYQATRRSARQEQIGISKLVARDFSQSLSTSTNQLQVFGESLMANRDLFDVTNDRLFPLILANPLWSEIGFYTLEGNLQAAAFRSPPSVLPVALPAADRDRVIGQKIIYVDPQPLADDPSRLRIVILVGEGGTNQGILAGEIAMDKFWQLTQTLDDASLSRILITTADGRLISARDPQLIKRNPTLASNPLLTGSPIAEYQSLAQDEVLGVRATIPETGWVVLIERPLDQIYADLNQLIINMLFVVIGAALLAVLVGWVAGRRLARPIEQLHSSVETFGNDPRAYVPIDLSTADELSELGAAFNVMAARLRENQEQLSKSNEELEQIVAERTSELEKGLLELQEYSKVQQQLIETVRYLGIPVVPITREIIIMNLVGEMSSERAADITPRLLSAIQSQRARIALIDVTGMPVIDTHVAQTIVEAVDAARLLGTEVVMVGIRPEIAETLVSLNVSFHFATAANLEQGFTLAKTMLQPRR